MSLPPHLAAELALVKNGGGETQIAIFEHHIDDARALAASGETLTNTIKLIAKREAPGAVRPQGMRKAFGRRYGLWSKFGAPTRPDAGADEIRLSIGDDRPANITWGE